MQKRCEQDYLTFAMEAQDDQEITFSMEDLEEIAEEERSKKNTIQLMNKRKKDKTTQSTLKILFFLFAIISITSVIISTGISNIPQKERNERAREANSYTRTHTSNHVNYNEECLKKARFHIQYGSGYSRQKLREKLKDEGFTDSQIDYALNRL